MSTEKADKRKPWMRFYTADWRGDAGLRAAGYAARGLWMDMISLMHEATPYGHLLLNGAPLNAASLAACLGGSAKEVQALLERLEFAGVFSRTEDGVIFSRRMVNEAKKAEQDRLNGQGGGNPALRGKDRNKAMVGEGVNPQANPTDNVEHKAHARAFQRPEEETEASASDADASPAMPDAKTELFSDGLALLSGLLGKSPDRCRPFLGKLLAASGNDCTRVMAILREAVASPPADPSAWLAKAAAAKPNGQDALPLMPRRGDPPRLWLHLGDSREDDEDGETHGVVGGYYLDSAADQVCEAAQIRSERWTGDWRPLIGWLRDGIDLPDVVAVVRRVASRRGYAPPSSLAYFDQAVRERTAA